MKTDEELFKEAAAHDAANPQDTLGAALLATTTAFKLAAQMEGNSLGHREAFAFVVKHLEELLRDFPHD